MIKKEPYILAREERQQTEQNRQAQELQKLRERREKKISDAWAAKEDAERKMNLK